MCFITICEVWLFDLAAIMTPVYSAIYALLTQFRFQTKGQQQHCSMIKMNSPYIFTCHSLAKIRRYRAKIFIFEFLGLRIGNIGVKLRRLGPKAANSSIVVTNDRKDWKLSVYIYSCQPLEGELGDIRRQNLSPTFSQAKA